MSGAVTVPLEVEGNRPFIRLTLALPGSAEMTGRFLVDTGGGGFLLTEPLARGLGVTWGPTMREQDTELGRAAQPPEVRLGEFSITLDPSRVMVTVGKDNMLPLSAPGDADGMLPGHILAQHHVVFDYPGGTFTLAQPDTVKVEGQGMAMPVSRRSGSPRTELTVDDGGHGFLLDSGASFTMVSEAHLKRWGAANPAWERHEGAVGEAVTLGGQTIETMIIPLATWGPFDIRDVGVVSQREGTFERWMSSMMAAPIIGSLGGNVLRQFRLELDYANEALYLSG